MNIRPTDDRIIVKLEQTAAKTKSGIIIANELDRGTTSRGQVVAVGPGIQGEDGMVRPMEVSVGDVVWFSKSVGIDVADSGEKYIIVHESDVLCVVG
jgi:chaperonin GroES